MSGLASERCGTNGDLSPDWFRHERLGAPLGPDGCQHVVPFPKGAPTAPELLVPDAASFDALRSELVAFVERIGSGPRDGDGPVHPLFGRLSFREWGVATYKHTDHHLRQFGA